MSNLRIEICKSYNKKLWQLRIGDIEGSLEDCNITKEEVLAEIKEKMENLDVNGTEIMVGIKVIGVKVVGNCSKCRKDGDEIPRNKDGSIIPDSKISCINTAFGDCPNQEKHDV